ncbi:MAG: SRPBCC family protein [Polyangiaceae bacterium]
MSDTILVTASMRIERPAAEVRAQYRDIDHHIRNNVHPSIHYQWEPGEPGERKIRTKFRILGVPQFDVSLLEDGEDGSFRIRYLEGTNAGMLLVHEFVPLGADATDVRLFANAPATRGRKLLGPLFVVGARQVMKKALAEDKRDLEKGQYVADIAAGDVEGALAQLSSLAARSLENKRCVLEAACLLAVADGNADAPERDAIARLGRLLGADDQSSWLGERLDMLARTAQTEAVSGHADGVAQALARADLVAHGVQAAAVVALASEGLSEGELSLLTRLGRGAGLDDESLAGIIERADAALSRR